MRPLSLIAATGAVALASLAVASPAVGAPLPPNQFVDVLQSSEVQTPSGFGFTTQYWRVDPVEAVSTPASASFSGFDFAGFDLNAQGLGWALEVDRSAFPDLVSYLVPVNGSTGEVFAGERVQIKPVNPLVAISECLGITYLPTGELVISCQDGDNANGYGYIGTVTTSGAFAPFFPSLEISPPKVKFEALAWDSSNDQLWAFGILDNNPGMPRAFLVNRQQGRFDSQITLTDLVISADFDRAGTLWAIVGDQLATVVPSTGAVTPIHSFQNAEHDPVLDVYAIAIRDAAGLAEPPAPPTKPTATLPATGLEPAAPLGSAAALMILLGATFMMMRRRRNPGERR